MVRDRGLLSKVSDLGSFAEWLPVPSLWSAKGATGHGTWIKRREGELSVTAGTLIEGTRRPLRDWFLAIWLVTSQKQGASALGLQRVLGLGSYQTAWTWMHKLRRPMVRSGQDHLTEAV